MWNPETLRVVIGTLALAAVLRFRLVSRLVRYWQSWQRHG